MFDNRSIYGNTFFYNMTFSEVFPRMTDFKEAYKDSGLYDDDPASGAARISDTAISRLYYLLYADYGNNIIASNDVNRFKYKVFSLIYQYGANWEKELDIQKKLRALSDEDLMKGATMIYNHGYNPSTEPSTATLEEITTINDQNTTKAKKSKVDAYAALVSMLDSDVTRAFLVRFKPLFKQIIERDLPLYYSEEE